MAIWKTVGLVLVSAISVALANVRAASAATSPSAFAAAVEKRAQGVTFDQLRRFGDAAMQGHDRESLRRLHYVAEVFRSQSEFELSDRDRTGDALKLLSHAETLIPEGDPDAAAAESTIWRAMGLALMNLNDMEGATRAFERSEFEFGNRAYPRPDFDAIYNLGHVAINLGDKASAEKL